MFTDSTEASGRAETEIHCDSLCLCVSKPQVLKEIENIYRTAESNRIRINILSKQTLTGKRLPIRSRAVLWGGGRVGDKSGRIWGAVWCLPPGNLLGIENGCI